MMNKYNAQQFILRDFDLASRFGITFSKLKAMPELEGMKLLGFGA